MSHPTNLLKPWERSKKFLKGKLRISRPGSPAPSQASLETDPTASLSRVGADEASESTSVAIYEGPLVGIPVANIEEANTPPPGGNITSMPVIILPRSAASDTTESPLENQEVPAEPSGSDQDIPNNPTLDDDPELEPEDPLWAALRVSLHVLKEAPNMLSDFVSAVEILLSCLDGLGTMCKNRAEFEDLTRELTTLSESLGQHEGGLLSVPKSDAISSLVISIDLEVRIIKGILDCEPAEDKTESNSPGKELIRNLERIIALFRRLQASLQANAQMSTQNINVPNQASVNTRLNRLNPAKEAIYNSQLSTELNRRSCTKGTREATFTELARWIDDPTSPPVYWIDGMAGTGKTTIAYTFCEQMEKRKLLAASFFCSRTPSECNDVNRIIPTAAYQLAEYSIPFRSALYNVLRYNPEAGSKILPKQFEDLLLEPTQGLRDTLPDQLIIVIDALDECDNLGPNGVEALLDLIFNHASDLPVKFLITSRPETEIYAKMAAYTQSRGATHLQDIDRSLVQADIKAYLTEELEFMSPTEAEIDQLVERSGVLFTHAAGLIRHARSGDHSANTREKLRSLINMPSEEQPALIDPLYLTVINNALSDEDLEADETEDIRVVLNTVLLAQEPVSIETIAMLGRIGNPRRVENALLPLRSALHHSEKTGLVSTLDSAFPEIMFSKERSGSVFCDAGEHSQLLVQGCFLGMKEQLHFNVCELESSLLPDKKVVGLQSRVKDKIPPSLQYACRYWANHLSLAANLDSVLTMLIEFLSCRLLFWMEVLNLLREPEIGVAALLKAKQRLEGPSSPPELIVLLDDAYHFVRNFAASPVYLSTPHIYISSLQLSPTSSMIYRIYSKHVKNWLNKRESVIHNQSGSPSTPQNWKVGSGVLSVAYSLDGTRIAVGCEDKTISIYDANNSSRVVGPLEGHTDWVRCVAFSPDGKHVISASSDCTIRKWDALNGTPVTAPFKGHSHPVKSIAFSPDGTKVVSGSWDNTVRLWNAADGSPAMRPLEGHKWGVNSVAFSPEGDFMASAGNDHVILLWDLTHNPVITSMSLSPGHTNAVTSIAFAPEGTQLVSGAVDCTIRIWNLDGTLINTFIQGCSHFIYSVAISPDGSCIASASADSSIRIWNIKSGNIISGPFMGHSSGVRTIAFSPDGTRLISGSHDESVKVWDLRAPPNSNFTYKRLVGASAPRKAHIRPGTRAPQESDHYTRQIQTFHQEKAVSPRFHSHAPAAVTSFAWLLDGSDVAYLNDPTTPTETELSPDSAHELPGGLTRQPDGWVVNRNSELIIWVPPPSGSYLPSHTSHNYRLLSLLSQNKLFVGNRWPGGSSRI